MSIYDGFSDKELEILRARAERVGSTTQDSQGENYLTALVVKVRGETYALPIETIANVRNGVSIIPVPCVPPFVAGIANIRGHIVPVLDLAILLDVPGPNQADASALVVAETDDMTVAFDVESIGEVARMGTGKLAPIPAALDIKKAKYLQGVLPDGTVLLDVDTILRDPTLITEETIVDRRNRLCSLREDDW